MILNFKKIRALDNLYEEKSPQVRALKRAVLKRERFFPHVSRKLYHMAMGLMCFSLYAFMLSRLQAFIALLILGGVVVIFDFIRLKNKNLNNLTISFFGPLMRREELKNITGHSFYVLGLLILIIFFTKQIVLLSILYLAIGDPVASIVGTICGRHKILGSKSVEGAIANFVLSSIVTLVVSLILFKLSTSIALILAIAGGCISVISELLPLPINDNFTIPVTSAILLNLLFIFFPVF